MKYLFTRSRDLIGRHLVIFGLLSLWAFGPLVAQLVYVWQHGGVLTGVDGSDFFDQFQYLSWIRDEGTHGLASNLWVIAPSAHDYVQPMYLISGLLWRIGLSLQLAYLLWKPVALVVLFLGFCVYVVRMIDGRWRQAAALALALFYESPALPLASWTGHISEPHRLTLVLASDDANSALNLWGFAHTAIAIGLMPVFLIAAEKLLAPGPGPGEAEHARSTRRRWLVIASIAGTLVSWLHPWQGVILLAIVAILLVCRPGRRRVLALAVPVVATVLPLVYGVILSRSDSWWRAFETQSTATGTAPWWALLASFGPLAVFAAAGIRRPRGDGEWMLLLWLVSCAGVYFLVPEFPPHALAGVTLPLAVLAVKGWERLRLPIRMPRRVAAATATAAVLAVTIPTVVYDTNLFGDDLSGGVAGKVAQQMIRVTGDQAAALAYLDRVTRPGGVLAPWLLSLSVPGFTGREVFAGHVQWQPHANVPLTNEFFDPSLHDPGGAIRRGIFERSRAVFVLADCGAPTSLPDALAPLARPVAQFGCVRVYERR